MTKVTSLRRIVLMKKYLVPIYFEMVNNVEVEVPDEMPPEEILEAALEKFNTGDEELILDKDHYILDSAQYDVQADITELPLSA